MLGYVVSDEIVSSRIDPYNESDLSSNKSFIIGSATVLGFAAGWAIGDDRDKKRTFICRE